jgi:hypothetical protein
MSSLERNIWTACMCAGFFCFFFFLPPLLLFLTSGSHDKLHAGFFVSSSFTSLLLFLPADPTAILSVP